VEKNKAGAARFRMRSRRGSARSWRKALGMLILSSLTFILLYGASYGMVLFAISVGLVVTMGLMRIVNMAHGVFAALGGYVALVLMNTHQVPYWIAIPAAALVVVVISAPIERLFFKRLYTATELDQVLMTIGLAFIGAAGLNLAFGPDPMPSNLPKALSANIDLGIRTFQVYRVLVVVCGAALMAALWVLFESTEFGARIRAAVDNRRMAEAVGINVDRLFMYAFALGCGLAAFGGAIGYVMLPLEPMYPFKYLTIILIVVSLCGFGNIRSAAVIAMAVGIVDTAGRFLAPSMGGFVIYVFLVLMMVWRSARPRRDRRPA
jgi:branched-chain amino acid transport system permease protein